MHIYDANRSIMSEEFYGVIPACDACLSAILVVLLAILFKAGK
jgi:hypothetical protein